MCTGFVTSPNYPNNYPDNLERIETIQVEQGLLVSLQFTAFEISYRSGFNICIDDHLSITDGDGTTLMEKSCGSSSEGNVQIGGQYISSSLPEAITSRSNVVNLRFNTDSSYTRSGWRVSWVALTPGECPQDVSLLMVNFCSVFFVFFKKQQKLWQCFQGHRVKECCNLRSRWSALQKYSLMSCSEKSCI